VASQKRPHQKRQNTIDGARINRNQKDQDYYNQSRADGLRPRQPGGLEQLLVSFLQESYRVHKKIRAGADQSAGAPGFEPGVPVLETGGLAINRRPPMMISFPCGEFACRRLCKTFAAPPFSLASCRG